MNCWRLGPPMASKAVATLTAHECPHFTSPCTAFVPMTPPMFVFFLSKAKVLEAVRRFQCQATSSPTVTLSKLLILSSFI